MTPAETARLMSYMAAAFSRTVEADTIAVWADSLGPVDARHANAAARRLATTVDRLPSLAAFLAACRDEARFARLAASAPALAPGEASFACRCGALAGWELVADGNPPTVVPCRYCQPGTRERWEEGHFEPGHTCADCARRRGAAA